MYNALTERREEATIVKVLFAPLPFKKIIIKISELRRKEEFMKVSKLTIFVLFVLAVIVLVQPVFCETKSEREEMYKKYTLLL